MDFAHARKIMVASQVRTNDVTDIRLQTALESVPREQFLPAEMKLARLCRTGNRLHAGPPSPDGSRPGETAGGGGTPFPATSFSMPPAAPATRRRCSLSSAK